MNSGPEIDTVSVPSLTAEEREDLEQNVKRCSAETREAIFEFRETGSVSLLPTIVVGIIERFLEPEIRPKIKEGDGSLKLIDDLGIDSLTMMEIVVLVEDSLALSIDNDELRDLRTIDDVGAFIDAKVKGIVIPPKNQHFGIEAIAEVIPHKPPFLFIKELELNDSEAIGTYPITGEEDFLKGHFPENPVFPASIMLEALGQLAVFFLIKTHKGEEGQSVDPGRILFTSCEAIRCQRVCVPGDVLTMTVKPKKLRHPIAMFEGKITVNGESTAWAENINLTFDFIGEASNEAETAVPGESPFED